MADLVNYVKRRGSVNSIKDILDGGCDVNHEDVDGRTALHWCTEYLGAGQEELCLQIITLLLERGADVNSRDHFGRTPIILFLEKKCSPTPILLLLENGAEVYTWEDGQEALDHYYSLLKDGRNDVFQILLDRFDDINSRYSHGGTLLMFFLKNQAPLEKIELLLDNGADVTISSMNDTTVLHFYATWRSDLGAQVDENLNLLRRLTGDGSLLNARNFSHETPLAWFVAYKLPIEAIRFLLDKGVNVNVKNINGNSILHLTSAEDDETYNKKVMQMLLEFGANPNAKNINGESRLSRAILHKQNECIKLLYNYGLGDVLEEYIIGTYIEQNYFYNCLLYHKSRQLVVKYMLLKNESALDRFISPELPPFCRVHVRTFLGCFIDELKRMKSRILTENMTLFKFAAEPNRRKYSLLVRNCSINFKVLENEFPLYSDIIISKIEISKRLCCTYSRLPNLSIATRQQAALEDEVTLKLDCLYHMFQYLSDNDIKNIVFASVANR